MRAGHCPVCGADLAAARSYVQEYWTGQEQNFLCWCASCRAMTTVTIAERVVLSEPEH
jgi:hypothetical protein